jgi:phosphatidylglycerol:prolipoprotein diacylglycerol transferase
MHPILFEIPGVGWPIRSFGVMLALGFVLGAHLWSRLAARYGDDPEGDPERVAQLVIWLLVGVVAGARLMYVVVEVAKHVMAESPDPGSPGATYLDEPWQVFAIWKGGLVMYGGFFGAVLLGTWKAHQYGLRPLAALDTGLVAGFFGQAVGRIGCLLVGDDYGSIVPERFRSLPFPITIRIPAAEDLHPESLFLASDPPVAGEVLWGVQLWMSANALVIALVGLLVLRRSRWAGRTSAVIFLVYAITRFVIEMFRGDSLRGVWAGGLSTSQLVSIPAAAIAGWVLYRYRGRREDGGAA